jgi:serpin B
MVYGAEMKELDFTNDKDREVARRAINHWVEQKTQDMIQELLKPDNLNKDSKLVLVNAIYFRSLWALPFPADQTKKEPFHASNGKTVQVPMMHLTAGFQYYEGDGVQVLELPYQGNHLSMVVILPKAADGLAEVENDLTRERVEGWLAKLKGYEVTTTLPKFTTAIRFLLGQELNAMGMPLAFEDGIEGEPRADFSGISDQAPGKKTCLHISEVVHEARVEVTEEGTKAAAATAVITATKSSAGTPPPRLPKTSFKADHSFLFFICERETRNVLFIGCVTRPSP